MGNKRKGQLTTDSEWHKHLRKIGKRFFWKGERLAEKKMIHQNLKEIESQTLTELEINGFEKLYDYLNLKLQRPVKTDDLNNLLFSLFCTLGFLPQNLHSLLISKKVLAKIFIKISREDNANFGDFENIMNENDWIEQLDNSLRLNKWPNIEGARLLLESN